MSKLRNNTDNTKRAVEASHRTAIAKRYGATALDLIERGWAAGFFDGEGHASSGKPGNFSCEIDQRKTERMNLERFCKIVGVGKVTDLNLRKKGNSQASSRWRITNQKDLQAVFARIGEFLGEEKRYQFAQALSVPIVTMLVHNKPLPAGFHSVEITASRKRKK